MRRSRWRGILAVGFSGLLLSVPTHVVAHADGVGGTGRAAPAATVVKVVALSAVQQVTRSDLTTAGTWRTTQSSSQYYRDSKGRTRVEAGSVVTISDPASATTLRLDRKSQTFLRLSSGDTKRQPDGLSDGLSTQSRDIGQSVVSGVPVEGRQYTVTIPASKLQAAKTKEVTVWLSRDLQLPVQTRFYDAAGQDVTTTYTDIRIAEPAADLFAAPAGYREGRPASQAGTNATCPLDIYFDPSVFVSVRPYGGYGAVGALTDVGSCLFVADAGWWESPLYLAAITRLLLPFDIWVFGDSVYGYVPFLPWVAFGYVAFAAANTSDVTVKDALFSMVIF